MTKKLIISIINLSIISILGLPSCSEDQINQFLNDPTISPNAETAVVEEPYISSEHQPNTLISQFSHKNKNIIYTSDQLILTAAPHSPHPFSQLKSRVSTICYAKEIKYFESWEIPLKEKIKIIEILPKQLLYITKGSDIQNTSCEFEFKIYKNNEYLQRFFIRQTAIKNGSSESQITVSFGAQPITNENNILQKILENNSNQLRIYIPNQKSDTLKLTCENFFLTLPILNNLAFALHSFNFSKFQIKTNSIHKHFRQRPEQACRLFSFKNNITQAVSRFFILKFKPIQLQVRDLRPQVPTYKRRTKYKFIVSHLQFYNPFDFTMHLVIPKLQHSLQVSAHTAFHLKYPTRFNRFPMKAILNINGNGKIYEKKSHWKVELMPKSNVKIKISFSAKFICRLGSKLLGSMNQDVAFSVQNKKNSPNVLQIIDPSQGLKTENISNKYPIFNSQGIWFVEKSYQKKRNLSNNNLNRLKGNHMIPRNCLIR